LINSNLKFNTVKSDQLFYGQYQYSASFQLQECWIFRYTFDHAEIDQRLTRQQEWREKMRQRWPADSMNRYHSIISDVTRDNIHSMSDFITGISTPYKIVVENRTMRIYTSDLNIIQAVEYISFLQRRRYSQVVIDRPKNTIRLKNPQYTYRSYFKETRVSTEDRDAIGRFLLNQPGIKIGQGLLSWLNKDVQAYASKYTRDYFYIDYHYENWLTMLALVRPGLIRKTMNIIAK
jgi:hypothetical protein